MEIPRNPFETNEFVQRWLATLDQTQKGIITGAPTDDLDGSIKSCTREKPKLHHQTKEERTLRKRVNVTRTLLPDANLCRGPPTYEDIGRRKRKIERSHCPSTLNSVSSPCQPETCKSSEKFESKYRTLPRAEKGPHHHHHELETIDDFRGFCLSHDPYIDVPHAGQILQSPGREKEDRSARYARRPRHKTKADKYEYKGHPEGKKPSTKDISKPPSKRRHLKKTGVTLSHDFKAPNIDQDRLTLKPNSGQGIFGKGKASSPIPRRGLPDLTFAEMTFLGKRRRPDEASLHKQKDNKTSKKKDNSSTQKLSEFFSGEATRRPGLRQISSETHHHSKLSVLTMQTKSTAGSFPAKSGARRALSILSENGSNLLHEKCTNKDNGLAQKGWIANSETPAPGHYRPSPAQPVARPAAENEAASHCSVSVIPSLRDLKYGSGNLRDKGRSELALSSHLPNEPPDPFSRDCSLSDSSLERYTKRALLGHEQNPWQFGRPPPIQANFYSLSDLKGLARVSEFDARLEDYREGDHSCRYYRCSDAFPDEFCTHQVQLRTNDATSVRPTERLLEQGSMDGDLVGSSEVLKPTQVLSPFQSVQARFERSPGYTKSSLPALQCLQPKQVNWILTGSRGTSKSGACGGHPLLNEQHNSSISTRIRNPRETHQRPSQYVLHHGHRNAQSFPSTWHQEVDIPGIPHPDKHTPVDCNNSHEMPPYFHIAEVSACSMRGDEDMESQDYHDKLGLEHPGNLNGSLLVEAVNTAQAFNEINFDESPQDLVEVSEEIQINDLPAENLEKLNSIVLEDRERDGDQRSSRLPHEGPMMAEDAFTGFSRPHFLY